MKRFASIFLTLIFLQLSGPGAMASERTIIRHYDRESNRTGYSVIENGRESYFSKDWKREGYSIHREDGERIDHFSQEWDRRGHSEKESNEAETPNTR